ncbi:MAG: hypothetical protein JNG90_03805 [Planctomycetaceae bacterium]|nr:hypothetical protein [Planctomycetaceae bacterium]
MPLGLDTPSTLGMVFFVLGPAFLSARGAGLEVDEAARRAWQIGVCAILVSGVFKLACATCAHWIRLRIPRAGLLGSLAAIALVLISFFPLLEITAAPVVGFVCLAITLATLVARVELPWRMPGALAALLVGAAIYYLMAATGTLEHVPAAAAVEPRLALLLPRPNLDWVASFRESLQYLPVVIPFALATVIGGIDCTESALAAGDEYSTGKVVAVEAVATLVAGLTGGVIQTTPYIGHPAYKAMGGRAAYVLATGLFIGGAGIFGYFAHIYQFVPQAAIFPILIFIGLEITAQSFQATPTRHYPAVALACLPAMAYLVTAFTNPLIEPLLATGKSLEAQLGPLAVQLQSLQLLANGFIITSLLWASLLAAIIDRRLGVAALYAVVAAGAALFGIIHSPVAGGSLVLPWPLGAPPEGPLWSTYYLAGGYALTGVLLAVWGAWLARTSAQPGTPPRR